MPSFARLSLLAAGLVAIAVTAAPAGIPISVPAGRTPSSTDEKQHLTIMRDAFACVAEVLSYRPNAAEASCGRLITAMPGESLGYKFRGLAYLLEHRFEQAEDDFHIALRLEPKDAENQAGYAQALSGQGRFADAVPHFEAALQLAPSDIRFLAASCWARAGEGGRLDLALRDCNRALSIQPQFATALQNRGLVRLKQKNWRAAIQDYSRAIANDGDRPTALFGRGFANLQIGETEKARSDIKAARIIDPEIDDLYILQNVLPKSCRDAGASCPLPKDLRQPQPSRRPPLLSASFQNQPFGHPSGFEDLDESLRAIEMGRVDVMLEHTAAALGVSLSAGFAMGWQDAELRDAKRHLENQRQEYRRQQRLACDRKLIGGDLCKPVFFHALLSSLTSAAEFRHEMDSTMDAVVPFWKAVCLASHELTDPCEIE
jgi:tetratricopeptide (TPR) repeat protein